MAIFMQQYPGIERLTASLNARWGVQLDPPAVATLRQVEAAITMLGDEQALQACIAEVRDLVGRGQIDEPPRSLGAFTAALTEAARSGRRFHPDGADWRAGLAPSQWEAYLTDRRKIDPWLEGMPIDSVGTDQPAAIKALQARYAALPRSITAEVQKPHSAAGVEIVEGVLVLPWGRGVPDAFWARLTDLVAKARRLDEFKADKAAMKGEPGEPWDKECALFRRWVTRVYGKPPIWPEDKGWTPALAASYLRDPPDRRRT